MHGAGEKGWLSLVNWHFSVSQIRICHCEKVVTGSQNKFIRKWKIPDLKQIHLLKSFKKNYKMSVIYSFATQEKIGWLIFSAKEWFIFWNQFKETLLLRLTFLITKAKTAIFVLNYSSLHNQLINFLEYFNDFLKLTELFKRAFRANFCVCCFNLFFNSLRNLWELLQIL